VLKKARRSSLRQQRGPKPHRPQSAPHDNHRAVEVESEIHFMDAYFGHGRAQPATVMRVEQQETAPAGADELAPGRATLAEARSLIFRQIYRRSGSADGEICGVSNVD
jgi:hypothetical protein